MYFAGLNHTQGVEAIVCLTTFTQFLVTFRSQRKHLKAADDNAGPVKRDGLPKSVVGRFVSPVHALGLMVPPVVYLGTVLANKLDQPMWMQDYRLPYEIGVGREAWARTAACVGMLGLNFAIELVLKHLGKQLHYIGVRSPFTFGLDIAYHSLQVREKPSIVSTGPYAIVRHPLYMQVACSAPLPQLM